MTDESSARARTLLTLGAVLGALAVVLGAFGAHGVEGVVKDLDDGAQRLEWWRTGARYHFWHALFVVACGLFAQRAPADVSRAALRAGVVATAGVVVFSGSLYTMTLTGLRWLGAITPLGGTAMIVAWVMLALAARKA